MSRKFDDCIKDLEAGTSTPTLSTIASLAQALGVELSLNPSNSQRYYTKSTTAGTRNALARVATRRVTPSVTGRL